jgi:hypothetical protein
MRNEKFRYKVKNNKYFVSFISHFSFPRGQALITLLFFMIIGLTITSASVVMILVNSRSGTKQQQGELAYQIALSGAENAMIRVLRTPPPTYTGETLSVGSGSATITVTGSGTSVAPYIITSKGTLGTFVRQVEVRATYLNNLLSVTSQKEIF